MNWHTSSKSALEKHPAFAALPESFRASVTEALPALSIWRKSGPLPVGTRWDVASNSIVFQDPIQLDRLTLVRDSTTSEWLWLANRAPDDPYSGTLSADGRSLCVNGTHARASASDSLAGTYARDVTAAEAGGSSQDAPADWTRPVLVLDLAQINDARLYDGAFPAYCQEARAITSATPAHLLWCYVSEIATGGTATAAVDTVARAELARVRAAITQFMEAAR